MTGRGRLSTGLAASAAWNAVLNVALAAYLGWLALRTWQSDYPPALRSALVAGEVLLAAMLLARPLPAAVDARVSTLLLVTVSVGHFPAYDAMRGGALPGWAAGVLAGLALWGVVARLCLGRSFGLLPARRAIVAAGPYALVRHPVYASAAAADAVLVVAAESLLQAALCVAGAAAHVVRALREEAVLLESPDYAAYARRVRWRLVPGLW
jgi:protein-S-isoprenylcysteine O-methyltransferase Ste14